MALDNPTTSTRPSGGRPVPRFVVHDAVARFMLHWRLGLLVGLVVLCAGVVWVVSLQSVAAAQASILKLKPGASLAVDAARLTSDSTATAAINLLSGLLAMSAQDLNQLARGDERPATAANVNEALVAIDARTGRIHEPTRPLEGGWTAALLSRDLAPLLVASFKQAKERGADLQLALKEIVNAGRVGLRSMIDLSCNTDSGELTVTAYHPQPEIAVLVANLVPIAFLSAEPGMPEGFRWQSAAMVVKRGGKVGLLALVVGLALVAAWLATQIGGVFSDRVINEAAIHALAPTVPVIGNMPPLRRRERFIKYDVDLGQRANSLIYNCIGVLAANLRAVGGAASVCVTSTIPREGKSLVAFNLAAYHAAHGHRTVLLQADVRRQTLEMFPEFEATQVPGYVEFLATHPDLHGVEQCIYPADIGNLFVCVSGRLTVPPNTIMESPEFRALVIELHRRFDVVVIDCAPLLMAADAAAITELAAATLLVVGMGDVRLPDLRLSFERLNLRRTRLAGIVLNRDRVTGQAANQARYYHDLPLIGGPERGETQALSSEVALPMVGMGGPAALGGNGYMPVAASNSPVVSPSPISADSASVASPAAATDANSTSRRDAVVPKIMTLITGVAQPSPNPNPQPNPNLDEAAFHMMRSTALGQHIASPSISSAQTAAAAPPATGLLQNPNIQDAVPVGAAVRPDFDAAMRTSDKT